MRKFEETTSINDLISGAMDKIKTLVDSSTIVGESIKTDDGVTIIPISKVTVGFVVGGGEYADLSSRRQQRRNECFPCWLFGFAAKWRS